MSFKQDVLSNKTKAKLAMEKDLEGRVPSFQESEHHKNMLDQLTKAEGEIDDNYSKLFSVLSDYQGKQLKNAIQQGTRYNLGTNLPWVNADKLPFPKSFTSYFFVQSGALFAECSGQIAFVEWVELPKSKASASSVLELQQGIHSISNVRKLLKDIWDKEGK